MLTCHAAYLPFLPDAIASIEAQTVQPTEKILVLDGCDYDRPPGWLKLRGEWANPNPARNLGWRHCHSHWIIFWDADDVMAPDYVKQQARAIEKLPADHGISYPVALRGEASEFEPQYRPWDYWNQRQSNPITTSSAWRRAALETVHGWPDHCAVADDLWLALDVTAAGWKAKALEAVVWCRRHGIGHRSERTAELQASLWSAQTFALVTIHTGRQERHLDEWLQWLCLADLPPKCSLHVVDSSGTDAFRMRLGNALRYIEGRFQHVSVSRWRTRGPQPLGDRFGLQRHMDVAEDYNRLFQRLPDDFVLVTDDDTVAPSNALRVLHGHFKPHGNVGAAAGLYETARWPGKAVGSLNKQGWELDIPWPCPDEVMDGGFIGGGCTLFANWALKKCLPIRATGDLVHGRVVQAWDGYVSRAIRAAGFRLVLDGRVKCQHNFTTG